MAPVAHPKEIAKTLKKGPKIDVKQAVRIAVQSFNEFYPELAASNLMLEEIEEGDDRKCWLITLGYDAKRALAPHYKMFQSDMYRAYKTFKVDNETGNVVSMKIRSVE